MRVERVYTGVLALAIIPSRVNSFKFYRIGVFWEMNEYLLLYIKNSCRSRGCHRRDIAVWRAFESRYLDGGKLVIGNGGGFARPVIFVALAPGLACKC